LLESIGNGLNGGYLLVFTAAAAAAAGDSGGGGGGGALGCSSSNDGGWRGFYYVNFCPALVVKVVTKSGPDAGRFNFFLIIFFSI